MRRKEPTQSIRIRQSDYDLLIAIMQQENLQTVTDAATWAIRAASVASNKR
jgi:hypothetical protein